LDANDRGQDRKLWGDGFEIETIINTRVAKAGYVIAEVPSFEFSRLHGQSNLNTWRDGGRVLRALVVERVNGKGRGKGKQRNLARRRPSRNRIAIAMPALDNALDQHTEPQAPISA
jgi:hypothetical protein